jgi:hypothetical protein
MHRILKNLPVLWLVALIVLPCTAPFSTCDWRDLLSGDGRRSPSADRATVDHALPHAPALRAASRPRPPRESSESPVRFVVPDLRPDLERILPQPDRRHVPSTLRSILRI